MRRAPRMSVSVIAALVLCTSTACVAQGGAVEPSPLPQLESEVERGQPISTNSTEPRLPINLDCEEVLTAQALYEFNPNFGTDPRYTVSGLASRALDFGGVACGWMNQTSLETLAIAVARLDSTELSEVRNRASSEFGVIALPESDGYFSDPNGVGVVEAFLDDYWVIVESPIISSPVDAELVLGLVVASLP